MRFCLPLTAVTSVVLATSATGQVVQVGDTPSYSFGAQTFNAQGIKGSDDLRGKPVLVDFWGTQ
jgi:hypothetical protein